MDLTQCFNYLNVARILVQQFLVLCGSVNGFATAVCGLVAHLIFLLLSI